MAFVSPQPTDSELEQFYKEDYFGGGASVHELTSDRVQAQIVSETLALCEKERPVILDYGCAEGGLWSGLAPDLQENYYGIEYDRTACERAAQATGRPVFRTIEELRNSGSPPWDLAFMINVVEHLRDPIAELRDLASAGAPGALIWVSTPNDRCLKRFLLGQGWDQYGDRTHLNLFSASTLGTVLRAAGYQNVQRMRFRLNYDHLGAVRSLGQVIMRPLGIDATLSVVASLPR